VSRGTPHAGALCVGLPAATYSELHEDPRYKRHRPEETVLYRVVAAHWACFRERVEEVGPLPRFVVKEIEEYLRCGILEHGHVRVACEQCGFAASSIWWLSAANAEDSVPRAWAAG
jgi:hypothetical protein